jgi:hypothetical protein
MTNGGWESISVSSPDGCKRDEQAIKAMMQIMAEMLTSPYFI